MRQNSQEPPGSHRLLKTCLGLVAATSLMTACVAYPDYRSGIKGPQPNLATDIARCRQQAEKLTGMLDQDIERLEAGSDEQAVGGLIGGMMAERLEKQRSYARCMENAGYTRTNRFQGSRSQ